MNGDEDSGFVPSPPLELTGELPDSPAAGARLETRAHYKRRLAEYVAQFGLVAGSERTLKRWVATGRQKQPVDLPPFDQPKDLAAWWRRNMRNKAPDWVAKLEQVGDAVPASTAGGAAAASVSADLPPDFQLHGLSADAGDAEKELWGMANGFKAEMEKARQYKDSKRWWNAYNEYRKLLDELRKWEKDRLTKRLQRGEVMETAVVVESLTRIFGSVSQTFTGCMLDLAKQLRPDMDAAEVRRLVLPLRDRMYAGLKESKFAAAAATEEAA
jgi:hypothetical protein